jgi:hypothetical protein
VLQYHFNWKTLSAMAGVTWWNFYFRLFSGAIKNPQVVEFLRHLMRHLPGKLLIIWDGLRSHHSHLVWDFGSRTQSGGVSVVALETARTTQLLPEQSLPVSAWVAPDRIEVRAVIPIERTRVTDLSGLDSHFQSISAELREQYTVRYASAGGAQPHQIRVEGLRPGMEVRAPKWAGNGTSGVAG